ncbi:KWG Leptospira [Paenibacillus konkukensis]|uniref:KWG Leptospira n=1 Tax=Paenibacillus konkukensis TaxID=2020716 RepID=A0ABY4RDE8_9BACL|nr:KWG Leptospira [Paenibacillus konkukensis]
MMNANEKQIEQLVRAYLPQGAELVTTQRSYPLPAICAADLDGDKMQEISAVYRLDHELHLLALKYLGYGWGAADDVALPYSRVSVLTAAPVLSLDRSNLIVGWQEEPDSDLSRLSVYEWTEEGLKDTAGKDVYFSFMEVMTTPERDGQPSLADLALWIRDSEEAYRVDIIRWRRGQRISAVDKYPLYYPKVVRYYEQLVRKQPDHPLYWYYLAEAQHWTGMTEAALVSADRAYRLGGAAVAGEKLQQLDRDIRLQLEAYRQTRRIERFPVSYKTIHGTKWGYIDGLGATAIPVQYDYASDFQENGLGRVQMRGHSGVINAAGQYVVQPIYDSIGEFSEGRSVVIDSQGFKLMDESGRIVTKKAYSYIASMQNGRAMFTHVPQAGVEASTYGYLDAQGNEVIPAQFQDAGDFYRNKAVVKIRDNEYALIGLNGNRIATYPYAFVGGLGDGLLPFQQTVNGKYGYIDEQGRVVLQPAYTGALPFQEGRAVVNTGENYTARYGVIDKQGRFVVQPGYNDIRQPGEGRLALGKAIDPNRTFIGSIYAMADLNGRMLTDFRYYDVEDYHQGLASVYDRNQTFFIDRSGHAAQGYPRLNGSGTVSLQDDLIQANVDRRLSYLNRAGQVIWRTNTVIPLREPYRVREEKYKPNKDYLVYYPQVEGMGDQHAQQKVNARLKQLAQVKPVPAHTQLDASFNGDFDVAFFRKNLLVLEINGYNFPFGAAHGMPTKVYSHINLTDGAIYDLKDLFKPGSPYVEVLSGIVGRQIKEDPQYSYVFPDTYKGIKPDQPFYVTEHALHLYFQPYDIAPYVAGFPTFTIPFSEIMDMIAVNGSFWRSFH